MTTRLAPLILGAALATGCVAENATSVQLQQLCTIPDDCTFGSSCDMQPLGDLVLDVGSSSFMWLAVEVNNNLINNGDPDGSGRLNTNTAYAEGYEVEYDAPAGITLPGSISGGLSNQVIPSEGKAVLGFTAIPSDVGTLLQPQIPVSTPLVPVYEVITANVRLKGRLDDLSKWETGSFRLPIRVCNGCITLPACTAPQIPVACPSPGQYPRGAVECADP